MCAGTTAPDPPLGSLPAPLIAPAESSASFSRSVSSRCTSHWRSGTVRAVTRIRTASLDSSCTPHTSGSSRMISCQAGSCHMASAVRIIVWRTLGMSWWYGTGKSTTALAQPWDSLPAFLIVPLRICQTTPFTSRSRVIRRLTPSTVPVDGPR